jgi:hypothetical protein
MCDWVRENQALPIYSYTQLRIHTSVHSREKDYFTQFPVILPVELGIMGEKIILTAEYAKERRGMKMTHGSHLVLVLSLSTIT